MANLPPMPTAVTLKPDLWVDRYADYLYNYALHRISDPELARDLVQETFFAGLKSATNFQGNSSERTWLVAILKRKIIDQYRKANSAKGKAEVKMKFREDSAAATDWLEERVSNPVTSQDQDPFENEELALALQECIGRLNPRQRQAFILKTIEGKDTKVICNALQIKPSNLWVMVHRARVALMSCLNETWFR